MKYAVASVLALAIGLVSAQSSTPSAADIPSCALPCFVQYVPETGCSLLDNACQCTAAHQAQIKDQITSCVLSKCQQADQIKTLQVTTAICALPINGGNAVAAGSAAGAAGSSAAASIGSSAAPSATSSAAGLGPVAGGSASTSAASDATPAMTPTSAMSTTPSYPKYTGVLPMGFTGAANPNNVVPVAGSFIGIFAAMLAL